MHADDQRSTEDERIFYADWFKHLWGCLESCVLLEIACAGKFGLSSRIIQAPFGCRVSLQVVHSYCANAYLVRSSTAHLMYGDFELQKRISGFLEYTVVQSMLKEAVLKL